MQLGAANVPCFSVYHCRLLALPSMPLLQEVERYEENYKPFLDSLGLDSLFIQQPFKSHGCVVAWDRSRYVHGYRSAAASVCLAWTCSRLRVMPLEGEHL